MTVISCLALRHRAEFCAVKCELNHNLMGWAGEAYAEVLAGIGCKCVCCLRLLDGYWFGWHDDCEVVALKTTAAKPALSELIIAFKKSNLHRCRKLAL